MTLLVAAALAAPLVSAPRTPTPTLIHEVWIFDSARGKRVGPVDVLLQDGRIDAIWTNDPQLSAMVVSLPDLDVVDGRDRTLLPGLIDAHVHAWGGFAVPGRLRLPDPRENLARFAYAGVTSIVDLSEDTGVVAKMDARIARGDVVGPHVVSTGRPFTAPGGHPFSTVRAMFPGPLMRAATRDLAWPVASNAAVDRAIGAEAGRVAVKVVIDAIPDSPDVPHLSAAALLRLRIAATALGIPMIAHVGQPADVDAALAAHVDGLAHVPWTGALRDDQIDALRGLFVIPTLVVWEGTAEIADGRVGIEPLEAEILNRFDWRGLTRARAGDQPITGPLAPWAARVAAGTADRMANVRRLHDAGVPIRVGSDGPLLGVAPGAGTHHELDLLVAAGLTPAEALTAATWTNRAAFPGDPRFGAIQAGWEADLLLVEGDPTVDIAAVHRIVDVWIDGRRIERHPRRTP